MSPTRSIAASLPPDIRQDIDIQALSRSQPISHIATTPSQPEVRLPSGR